jgi:hypothetical protein
LREGGPRRRPVNHGGILAAGGASFPAAVDGNDSTWAGQADPAGIDGPGEALATAGESPPPTAVEDTLPRPTSRAMAARKPVGGHHARGPSTTLAETPLEALARLNGRRGSTPDRD